MGYQIRMVPEVEQWLAGVRDRDPAAAAVIDEAVAELRAGGESVGPPLVNPVDDPVPGGVRLDMVAMARVRKARPGRSVSGAARWLLARTALPGLDAAYQQLLAALTPVRRTAADVATSRKRVELQIEQLERQISVSGADAGREEAGGETVQERLAGLRGRYADLQAEEERVTLASQRLQAKLDAFRDSAAAVKAAYSAAAEAAEVVWAEMSDAAGANAAGADAEATDPDGEPDPARPAFWLSELRPGAPEAPCARILFTVEPSGTAVLLAAATEADVRSAWYAGAVARSRSRYRREQHGTRPRQPS